MKEESIRQLLHKREIAKEDIINYVMPEFKRLSFKEIKVVFDKNGMILIDFAKDAHPSFVSCANNKILNDTIEVALYIKNKNLGKHLKSAFNFYNHEQINVFGTIINIEGHEDYYETLAFVYSKCENVDYKESKIIINNFLSLLEKWLLKYGRLLDLHFVDAEEYKEVIGNSRKKYQHSYNLKKHLDNNYSAKDIEDSSKILDKINNELEEEANRYGYTIKPEYKVEFVYAYKPLRMGDVVDFFKDTLDFFNEHYINSKTTNYKDCSVKISLAIGKDGTPSLAFQGENIFEHIKALSFFTILDTSGISICKICGKVTKGNRSRRTCSPRCRQIAKRLRDRSVKDDNSEGEEQMEDRS